MSGDSAVGAVLRKRIGATANIPMPTIETDEQARATGAVCARCGKRRTVTDKHGRRKGWRRFVNGVGYCDPCADTPGPWMLGLGHYNQPVWENF